jgi:hypothetical protein
VIDVECEAEWLLRPFPGVAPGARALIAAHQGAVVVAPLKGRDGDHCRRNRKPVIMVRPKLPRLQLRWVLIHELCENHLDELDYREHDREEIAEAMTAAIVMPRRVLHRAVARHGRCMVSLADAFSTTQTSVALRLGEARCVEASAVVRPGLVRVRAPDGYVVPSERDLKAAADGAASPLERHVLTDARRRVALLVA